MNVEDYYPQGKRWWVRLHEKGGKQHEMPAHHLLETYIDAYVTAAGIGADKTSPLFRTLGGRGRKQLGAKRMSRQDARRMIVRRARAGRDHHRSSAVTPSGRPASPSICSTAGCSNTRSRWRRTKARARPSSTIAATTRSRSIRSNGSCFQIVLDHFGAVTVSTFCKRYRSPRKPSDDNGVLRFQSMGVREPRAATCDRSKIASQLCFSFCM